MSLEIKLATFNVSSVADLFNHFIDDPRAIAEELGNSTDQKLTGLSAKLKQFSSPTEAKNSLSKEEAQMIRAYAREKYGFVAPRIFQMIDENFCPDIICLQELFRESNAREQKGIRYWLTGMGYAIIDGSDNKKTGDTAIAYRKSRFTVLKTSITQGDALYADLQEVTTKKIIRIVSDHVPGFRTTATRDDIIEAAKFGDAQLQKTLGEVDVVSKGFFKKIFSQKVDSDPDLIIFGLDSNTTTSNEIHPERMKMLTERDFIEADDHTPTIIDHSSKRPYKFDHICVKGVNAKVSIQNEQFEGLSGEAALDRITHGMSDHTPVFSRIMIS